MCEGVLVAAGGQPVPPAPRRHHRLVRPRHDLDVLGQGAVPGDRAVVVPVGAHQIDQQFGIGSIRLAPRDVVAVAVVVSDALCKAGLLIES